VDPGIHVAQSVIITGPDLEIV